MLCVQEFTSSNPRAEPDNIVIKWLPRPLHKNMRQYLKTCHYSFLQCPQVTRDLPAIRRYALVSQYKQSNKYISNALFHEYYIRAELYCHVYE